MHHRITLGLLAAVLCATLGVNTVHECRCYAGRGRGTAVRHDARVRGTRRCRSLRNEFYRDLRRSEHQASGGHGDADAEQHDLPASTDAGRHRVSVRVQNADPLSLRSRTDGLPCHRHRRRGQSRPCIRCGRARDALSRSHRPGRDYPVAGRREHADLLAHGAALVCSLSDSSRKPRLYLPGARSAAFVKSYLALLARQSGLG